MEVSDLFHVPALLISWLRKPLPTT